MDKNTRNSLGEALLEETWLTLDAGLQLGIFLCMRCASLHRKLGTHISKVKSLSMDSWSNDQVDVNNLRRILAIH